MTILTFPKDKSIAADLEAKCCDLEEMHSNLSRAYEICQMLEDRIHEQEQAYNLVLSRYCNAVGVENVPVRYFEYASENIEVNLENGEIVFTPWSEEDEEEQD